MPNLYTLVKIGENSYNILLLLLLSLLLCNLKFDLLNDLFYQLHWWYKYATSIIWCYLICAKPNGTIRILIMCILFYIFFSKPYIPILNYINQSSRYKLHTLVYFTHTQVDVYALNT